MAKNRLFSNESKVDRDKFALWLELEKLTILRPYCHWPGFYLANINKPIIMPFFGTRNRLVMVWNRNFRIKLDHSLVSFEFLFWETKKVCNLQMQIQGNVIQ
jgi:hypothetical protein